MASDLRNQELVTLLLRRDLIANRLGASMFVTADVEDHDYLIRPKLTWHASDSWSAILGGDWFNGKSDRIFGQFSAQSRISIELSWSPEV
ncbi:MAG: hypothetical protein ACI89D_002489 [Bermanella sp.]|jgi:hypothetical protein